MTRPTHALGRHVVALSFAADCSTLSTRPPRPPLFAMLRPIVLPAIVRPMRPRSSSMRMRPIVCVLRPLCVISHAITRRPTASLARSMPVRYGTPSGRRAEYRRRPPRQPPAGARSVFPREYAGANPTAGEYAGSPRLNFAYKICGCLGPPFRFLPPSPKHTKPSTVFASSQPAWSPHACSAPAAAAGALASVVPLLQRHARAASCGHTRRGREGTGLLAGPPKASAQYPRHSPQPETARLGPRSGVFCIVCVRTLPLLASTLWGGSSERTQRKNASRYCAHDFGGRRRSAAIRAANRRAAEYAAAACWRPCRSASTVAPLGRNGSL